MTTFYSLLLHIFILSWLPILLTEVPWPQDQIRDDLQENIVFKWMHIAVTPTNFLMLWNDEKLGWSLQIKRITALDLKRRLHKYHQWMLGHSEVTVDWFTSSIKNSIPFRYLRRVLQQLCILNEVQFLYIGKIVYQISKWNLLSLLIKTISFEGVNKFNIEVLSIGAHWEQFL